MFFFHFEQHTLNGDPTLSISKDSEFGRQRFNETKKPKEHHYKLPKDRELLRVKLDAMSENEFHDAGSVFLRDLGKLVAAVSEKQNSTFRVNNDERDFRYHTPDGIFTGHEVDSESKDLGRRMPGFPRDHQYMPGTSKTKFLVPENEPNTAIFKKRFNGAISEGKEKGGLYSDSAASTGTDIQEGMQHANHTRNSLYLISELCDRLVETAPQTSKRYGDSFVTLNEATLVAVDTPTSTPHPQRLIPAREQIVLSHAQINTHPSHYEGFTSPNLSTMQISPPKNTTEFVPHKSRLDCNSPQSKPRDLIMTKECVTNATEQDYLTERHDSDDSVMDACEPTGAISHIQQMLERFSPPVTLCKSVVTWQGSDPITQLSRDRDQVPSASQEGCDTGNV